MTQEIMRTGDTSVEQGKWLVERITSDLLYYTDLCVLSAIDDH